MCFVSEIFIFPFIDEGLVFAWNEINRLLVALKSLFWFVDLKQRAVLMGLCEFFLCCILSFVSILVFLGENGDVLLLLSICQEGCLFDVSIDLGVMRNVCMTKLFVA